MNRPRPLYGLSVVLLVMGLLIAGGCGSGKEQASDTEKEPAGIMQEYASGLVSGYDRAKATGTAADMKAIGAALSAYQLDHDDYPRVSGIDALVQALSPDYLRMASAT